MATYGTFVDDVTLTAAEANDIGVWYLADIPIVRQSSSIATLGGVTRFINYVRINKLIFVICRVQLNGNGTSNTRIEVDIPVTADSGGNSQVVGSGAFFDSSGNDWMNIRVVQYSTTRFAFLTEEATAPTNYLGMSGGTNVALAVNDSIRFQAVYRVA